VKAADDKGGGLMCPGCALTLAPVYAEANYGRVLLLDQCPGCGGVWFDRWELFFIKGDALENLSRLDESALLALNPTQKGTDACPRCSSALAAFTDPALPADSTIKRCPRCNGLWLNRGELRRYSIHRRSFDVGRAPSPDRAIGVEVLRRLQKELKAETLAAAPEPEGEALDAPPLDGGEFAKDMGFLILETLLRLVFKF
jgi:Zn-finger nucleic acid-binding protein